MTFTNEESFLAATSVNDFAGIDRVFGRLWSSAEADYHGARIPDLTGEETFLVSIDGREWPASISGIGVDNTVGVRFLNVSCLPPRVVEGDDDKIVGYSFTLERLIHLREWQILPGSFKMEPLT